MQRPVRPPIADRDVPAPTGAPAHAPADAIAPRDIPADQVVRGPGAIRAGCARLVDVPPVDDRPVPTMTMTTPPATDTVVI